MKMNKWTYLIWSVSVLISLARASSYKEVYTQYCTTEILNGFNITDSDRSSLRISNKFLSASPPAIQSLIQSNDVMQLLKEIGAPVIIMAFLVLLCLASFIVYLSYCCCCDRAKSSTQGKVKICWGIGTFCLVIYAGLFATSIVFMNRLNTNNNDTQCFLAGFTQDMLDGVVSPELTFIGFNNLTTIIQSFQSEMGKISELSKDFDSILNKELSKKSLEALDSLPVFYTNYKDLTTADGNGGSSIPLTIQNLTYKINDAIDTEFTLYNTICNQIDQAAVIGKQYADNGNFTTIQNSITQLTTQIDNIGTQIISVFDLMQTGYGYYNQYYVIAFWVSLGEGAVIFILGTLSLILICFMLKGKSKWRIGVKLCLGFNGFFIFIISIIALALFVGSIGIGSACNILVSILDSSDISSELSNYNISLDPSIVNMLNQCLPEGASGDLSKLFTNGTDLFSSTQGFLSGLSTYETVKNNLTQASKGSPTINATVEVWQKFKTSIYPDQPNAVVALAQFNNLISCGNIQYQLNSLNCTDNSTCKGIYDTPSFSPPSCASATGSQSNTIFSNLKQFTIEENSLLGNMTESLQGSAPSTPASLNAIVRTTLIGVVSSLDSIQSKLTNTVALANSFSNGFANSINCTVVRQELYNLESSLCFNLNKNLFFFATFLCLCVLFLFMFSWMICCAMRYLPEDFDPVLITTYDHNETTYSINPDEQQLISQNPSMKNKIEP